MWLVNVSSPFFCSLGVIFKNIFFHMCIRHVYMLLRGSTPLSISQVQMMASAVAACLPPCLRQALFAAGLCTWTSEAAAGAWEACPPQLVLPCGSLGKPLELLRRLKDLSP